MHINAVFVLLIAANGGILIEQLINPVCHDGEIAANGGILIEQLINPA